MRTIARPIGWIVQRFAAIAATVSMLFVAGMHPQAVAASASLPLDRLHFGLSNLNSSWMTESGVPWKYRYQYLAGGIGTNNGWETWNSPPGQFASYYLSDTPSGTIPVLTYYEILQSKRTSDEATDDYLNLNDAALMNGYYSNFKLLLTKAAAYGKTTVIHVEPDLWAYLQQRAGNGSPTGVSASVASSSFADVQGYPNNVAGFGQALIHLRDLYAPNVLLAIHASMWSSMVSIGGSTATDLNVIAEADKTAAFLSAAGNWDMIFNDVDDHDAGWWESRGANNSNFTHWWDASNRTFPNFGRYLAWVGELHARTGRPQVVWQVPAGNQWFLTMNNTCGHYQDNRAEYFIAHAADLFAAGIVAVLFGAGNDCQTSNEDARGDGITNNGGSPTTDAQGSCYACNTHPSAWADDDGGYLRTFVGRYYSGANYTSLGGVLASGPGASSWGGRRLDVFVQGSDGRLWHRWRDGGSWFGWEALGATMDSGPAAASWAPGRVDAFYRGADAQLWHTWFDGIRWNGPESLGGVLRGAPTVAAWGAGRLDVFVRGSDDQLWHKWFDAQGAWSGWQPLGGLLTSSPGSASWSGGRLDVVVRGSDNGVWHRWWDGRDWQGWESLGGSLSATPAVASPGQNRLTVVGLQTGGAVGTMSWTGSSWTAWQAIGGVGTADPGAASTAPGGVDIVVRGTDSGLWVAQT